MKHTSTALTSALIGLSALTLSSCTSSNYDPAELYEPVATSVTYYWTGSGATFLNGTQKVTVSTPSGKGSAYSLIEPGDAAAIDVVGHQPSCSIASFESNTSGLAHCELVP